ncbi:MAG: hypothetical protein ACMUIM_03440 [bacterium]
MKKGLLSIIIFIFSVTLLISFFFNPVSKVSAQTYNCIVRRDVNIPYTFQYFKTKILANAAFEIKFTVRDNFNTKVYVRLIPGANDPAITVDDKTLSYHLGSDLYGSTKTDYEVLGSSEDDVEIPSIGEMFFQAAVVDGDWIYDYDSGEARITDITISCNQARIKYLEFWDNEFRDANMHPDSQEFGDYANLDDAEWENLTPDIGIPTILGDPEVLYLNVIIPSPYIPPTYPPYYNTYYGSFNYPRVSYGNYWPSNPAFNLAGLFGGYPGGSYSTFRGNYPATYSWGGYPGTYTGNYLGNYMSSILYSSPANYFNTYYSNYPFGFSGGFFGTNYGSLFGLSSLRPNYGFGLTSFNNIYF